MRRKRAKEQFTFSDQKVDHIPSQLKTWQDCLLPVDLRNQPMSVNNLLGTHDQLARVVLGATYLLEKAKEGDSCHAIWPTGYGCDAAVSVVQPHLRFKGCNPLQQDLL